VEILHLGRAASFIFLDDFERLRGWNIYTNATAILCKSHRLDCFAFRYSRPQAMALTPPDAVSAATSTHGLLRSTFSFDIAAPIVVALPYPSRVHLDDSSPIPYH